MEETTVMTCQHRPKSKTDPLPTLCNQAVQVFIVWSLNAQVTATNIIDGLIVDHEAAVGVLQSSVSSQDGVVWLDHRGGDLRSGIDAELELALLAIIDRQAFHEQSAETRACASTE